jgi:hypothetical protein
VKGHGEPGSDNLWSTPVVVTRAKDCRSLVRERYDRKSVNFYYNKMVKEICPHLQFNAKTQQRIDKQKRTHGISDFPRTLKSVAFHVRRGGKIGRESRKFLGDEYVGKLQLVASNVRFEYCFVATDDNAAVMEILEAIKKDNIDPAVGSCETGNLHFRALGSYQRNAFRGNLQQQCGFV